jgi:ParB-like chromosome segregation protein Spo0J
VEPTQNGFYVGSVAWHGAEPLSILEREVTSMKQPLDALEWVPRDAIEPNDYNPNKQPPPEFRLLKVSLLEDGWTQPIVVFDDGSGAKPVIVDGEHRWRTSADPEIAALTGGLVPIVRIRKSKTERMMSTIRHNRARGEHGVLPMSEIVNELLANGVSTEDLQFLLQMEEEEIDRLSDRSGMPNRVSTTSADFAKGWIPDGQ